MKCNHEFHYTGESSKGTYKYICSLCKDEKLLQHAEEAVFKPSPAIEGEVFER